MKLLFLTLGLILAQISIASADHHEAPQSIIRINSTLQEFSTSQPWDKQAPFTRRGLGAVLKDNQVITTAEMVANATHIELENADGTHTMPAKAVAVDYEANLALIEPITSKGKALLSTLKPLTVAQPAALGDSAEIWQIERNGMPLITKGRVQGIDVVSSFIDNHYFLTYEIKASMQSAAGSYTLPVLQGEKLLGILTSYDSSDQLIDAIAPEIITAFLADAADGQYTGFPTLGIGTHSTIDPHFRAWLKLSERDGGLYISRIKRNSSAEKAGVKAGDVLLAVNGHAIDRRGYYRAKNYGQLYWSHLIRGENKAGDTVKLEILREGKPQELSVTLDRSPEGLIPTHTFGSPPRFLIKGGLVFQELSRPYLTAFGDDWNSRAPLSLLDAFSHPADYEEGRNRLVFLSAVIPTPATLGYEQIRSVIVNKVNGKKIKDIPSLIEAFEAAENGIHTIELDDSPHTIYLDAKTSDQVDQQFIDSGLSNLYRK